MKIIDTENIEKAKQLIKKSEKPIIVLAKDEIFNRKILEYGKFNALISLEMSPKKRKLRQVSSGLNHVLANIASRNKVSIGFDFELISSLNKKQKAIILSRIKQNILICRKSKARIIALNYSEKRNAYSFLTVLGASSVQAKQAISF
jgi:RNase P/RNase MRP subunit p30